MGKGRLSPEDAKKRQESYKTKVPMKNFSKIKPKEKIRYGIYAENIHAGYWHNGIWRPQI